MVMKNYLVCSIRFQTITTHSRPPLIKRGIMQSVKSEVKNSDSPRMNEMKERKKKRRANMKKELEEKRKK